MGTTRLLAGSSGYNGLHSALENVAELKGLDKVTSKMIVRYSPSVLQLTYEFQIMLRSLIPTLSKVL